MENKRVSETKKENERYLYMIFNILKKRDQLIATKKMKNFKSTELRMINEILSAKYEGRRLISTQLATLLGITRSAVSQIVTDLENRRVVKRVADDVDRKIAYVEITDDALELFKEDWEVMQREVGRLVEKFGTERFETMYTLLNEFVELAEEQKRSKNQ